MRNIKKFAKDNGLKIEESNKFGTKVIKVTIGDKIVRMEERESTSYYSVNGWRGHSEKYSMNVTGNRYADYVNTQREMIERMEKMIAEQAKEVEAVEEVQEIEEVEATEYEKQLDAENDAMFEAQEAEKAAQAKKTAKIEKARKLAKEYDDEIEAAMLKVFGNNLNDTMIDRLCDAAEKNGESIGRGQSAKYTFKKERDDVGYYCSVWIGDRKIGEVLPCDYRHDFYDMVHNKMHYDVKEIKDIEKIMFYDCKA